MRPGRLFLLLITYSLLFAQQGARYLIITHDNFYNIVQELARWKTQKGMLCRVARLSEIGSSNTAIRNYIISAYNNWNPRPEYLLLVGSPSLLPSFYVQRGMIRYYTDNHYANVTGDYRAEIPYGRLPCKTLSQCSVMVRKILLYERDIDLSDSLWMVRGVGIVNEEGDDDDTIYWNNVRFACRLMGAANFVQVDTFSYFRGHTAASVVQAVNSGRGIVLYRGVAGGNWYWPFNVNVRQLNNVNRLPIVASITCQTLTLSPVESMVGEAWLKQRTAAGPSGAVAFFGTTHSWFGVAPVRGACTRGFFRSLFSQDYQLGKACLAAKESIYARFYNQAEYEGFTLLGDPELNVLTARPRPLDVSYPETIRLGNQAVTIRVGRLGVAIPNALVCLWKGEEVYKYGYTDSAGEISFSINPQTTGEMSLTVTFRNSLPFRRNILVAEPTGINEETKGNSGVDLSPREVYDALGRRRSQVKRGIFFVREKGRIRKLVILR